MEDLERKKATEAAEWAEAKATDLQAKHEALLGQHSIFERRLAAENTAAAQKAAQSKQRALELESQQ